MRAMKKLRRFFAVVFFIYLLVPSNLSADPVKDITISAAASLKNVFEEIGRLYEAKYGAKCIFNFAASGDLARQIIGGAPVDVFASASQKDMDELGKRELIISMTRADFAANSIVLIVPAGSKAVLKSFEGLNKAEIKKIALGNPKTVPAGRYAEETLNFYKIIPLIKDKLIYAENVRQVLDYVARGEVDAGIVYSTDVVARSNEIKVITIAPVESHKPVVYPIAVVKGTKNETEAKAFISLVLSQDGRKILEKYGFKTIK
ncbi:MAG: molybdate ABC transporter substrate-binding protein [Nitrospiraceae bacterium]|nr:molybdate ABC transporter substrate-binding protein [Nitrospiraceae bacterium]